jgi:hypothetical protein
MKALPILLALVLVGCTDKATSSAGETETRTDQSVFDPLTDAVDRANEVEETLRQSAAARRAVLDEAE